MRVARRGSGSLNQKGSKWFCSCWQGFEREGKREACFSVVGQSYGAQTLSPWTFYLGPCAFKCSGALSWFSVWEMLMMIGSEYNIVCTRVGSIKT